MKIIRHSLCLCIVLVFFISLPSHAQKLTPFVSAEKKVGYKNAQGKIIITPQFETADGFYEGRAKAKLNEKWGYIDSTGKWIITPNYDLAEAFSNGAAPVNIGGLIDGKWAYIDKKGKELTPFTYRLAHRHNEGMALVFDGSKYGFIDEKGKLIIALQYLEANDFSEGLALVFKGSAEMSKGLIKRIIKTGKFGFINKKGEVVIAFAFDKASDFKNGKAMVEMSGKKYFINNKGEEVDDKGKKIISGTLQSELKKMVTADSVQSAYRKKLTGVITRFRQYGDTGPYGLINSAGDTIAAPIYNLTISGNEGIACANKNGEWFIINNTGKQLGRFKAIYTRGFTEGLAAVEVSEKKWVYVDTTGQIVIDNVGTDAYDFRDGMAKFKRNGSEGYIDKTGKELICCYNYIDRFYDGWAIIYTSQSYGPDKTNYVNLEKKKLLPNDHGYTRLNPFSNGYAILEKKESHGSNSWYRLDTSGKVKYIGRFEDVKPISDKRGLMPVSKFIENTSYVKWGYSDFNGQMKIPLQFNQAYPFNNGYASVKIKENEYWLIDTLGNKALDFVFKEVNNYDKVFTKLTINKQGVNRIQRIDSFFVFNKVSKIFSVDTLLYASIAAYKKKQAELAAVKESRAIQNNTKPSTLPEKTQTVKPAAPVFVKVLTNSFTKYYYYKKESFAGDKLVEDGYKIDVTPDYIIMYTEGNGGAYVFWQEYKIVASDYYNQPGQPKGLAYLTSNDMRILFSTLNGKDYLIIQNKSGSTVTEYLGK